MRVSPIQRMAAMILVVGLIFWFYKKQNDRFEQNNMPLISGTEHVIYSQNAGLDKLYLENVLKLNIIDVNFNEIIFREGVILKNMPTETPAQDTLQLRTRKMKDVWANVLASQARIIQAPDLATTASTALFILPGGTPVRLVSRN